MDTSKKHSPPLTRLYTKCYHHPHKEDMTMLYSSYFAFTFPAAFAAGLKTLREVS